MSGSITKGPTKREKMEELDENILDAMIFLVRNKDYEAIKDLGTAVTYLKNNQVITPPEKEDTIGDRIKDAIE